MSSNRTHTKGYTLAEVIAVVIIAAALTAVAGNLYVRGHRSRLLEKSATDLLHAVRYARVLAIEKQQPCRLTIERNTARFALSRELFDESDNHWREILVDNQFSRPVQLPRELAFGRIEIQPPNDPDNAPARYAVEFAPSGAADAAVVELTDGRNVRTLVIAPTTGLPRLYKGQPDQPLGRIIDLDGL